MILLLIADGRSIHTQRWAEYFARQGHEVHLITYDPVGRTIAGVTEYLITSRWQNLYLAFWPRHLQILKVIRKVRPDIIHAHFISKYGFHLPFIGRLPKIVSAWGDDVLVIPQTGRFLHYYTRLVLECCDLVYAVSEDIRTHIIQDFGIPEKKVKWFPFGVDTTVFIPKENKEEKKSLTLFSNRGFLPIYGMDTVLDGFSLAYETCPSLRLVMKGEGPDKDLLQQRVRQRGLEQVVTFPERSDYYGVTSDLRESDIFITAAGRDGTPVSLLEAMATGLPSIATAVGGIPEWITDNENGILIPPGDAKALAKKILLLAKNPRLRQQIGAKARETIVRNGDWSTLMEKATDDYRTISALYSR